MEPQPNYEITRPDVLTWRCTSIYSDEDIGRIREVHRMLWSGFVQVAVAVELSKGSRRIEPEDLVVYYEFTQEDDSDVGVSFPGYDYCEWTLRLDEAPDKLEAIRINEEGNISLEFAEMGSVTFQPLRCGEDFPSDKVKAYQSFEFAARHFLKDLLK